MAKKNIAVAMGGYSTEFEISLKSGQVVCEALNKENYNVFPIHILKEGWFYVDANGTKTSIDRSDFSFQVNGEKIVPDAIFNTIHGHPGEDGYLQAYWDLLKIPYTTPGSYQSALSFNKKDCLTILKNYGVLCANSYYIRKGEEINKEEIIKKVGLPCFVKPSRAGSSFGISKINEMEKLDAAFDKAFTEDSEIIIETAIKGTEVSVGVFRKDGKLVALPPTEIVSQNEFFDYEAKYLGKSEEITPARISDKETEKVQAMAKHIYAVLNMSGVTRSDFILQKEKPYFIETNTTPGLSRESIVPKQVKQIGMTLEAFFGLLVENALK